jgi:hypothetical protein
VADDAWLDTVPIRMLDTIAVEERLPPGAAAVLINQTHTDRDLFLPITAADKRMFDAVDGARTVGDIAGSPDTARVFFERLWRYDQIVFDAHRMR